MIQTSDRNGLKVLTESFPVFHSVALGLIFNQGSRDESASEQGLTHLIEHMLFKGTARKSAADISRTIESIGGTINGFTHQEMTGIFIRFMAEHTDRVLDLLLEIVNESQFAAGELTKEREVVFEEIKSGHEDPETEVEDLLYQAMYGDDPLGFVVSGELATVGALSDQRLRDYYRTNYARNRAVLVAAGDMDHETLSAHFDAGLGLVARANGRVRAKPLRAAPGTRVHERHELSQVFLCVAKPGLAYPDPGRCALSVLNAAFGGATSSRLFRRLREDDGLVYSVSSFAEMFSDTGIFGVFLVTDRKKLDRTIQDLKQEWNRLVRDNLEPDELETSRNYTKGSIILSQESLSSRMMRLAHNELQLNRVVPLEESLADLNGLTRDDIAQVLAGLGRFEDYCVSAVGPITEKELKELL
jgi:predicted Zn-dependent peptidase